MQQAILEREEKLVMKREQEIIQMGEVEKKTKSFDDIYNVLTCVVSFQIINIVNCSLLLGTYLN